MTEDQVFKKVQKIAASVFGIAPSKLKPETSMKSLDSWDSLNHIKLITQIEDGFKTSFGNTEIFDLTSIDSIVKAIKKHLK